MTCIKAFAISALALAACVANAQDGPQQLRSIPLTAGMHVIQAEVAVSPQERSTGLMHRKTMPTNRGMLFVFEEATPQCFWMKNTLLPLSIAFIADDGRVVNIADMKPLDENSHCSTGALCAGDESGLVCQTRHQGWHEAARRTLGTLMR